MTPETKRGIQRVARTALVVVVHYVAWWHVSLIVVGIWDGALALSPESLRAFFFENYIPSFRYMLFRPGREFVTLTQIAASAGTTMSVLGVTLFNRRKSVFD